MILERVLTEEWNRMNWNRWAAIAEILSSIAILVTLAYLAIQTQQNNVALNAESRATLFDYQASLLDLAIEDPDLILSWDQQEPLTPEQKVKLGNWLFRFLGLREYMWLQSRDGTVDDQTMETLISDIDQLLVHPRLLNWWNLTSDFYFDPGFVQVVNSRLTEEYAARVPDWMNQWE